MARWGGETDNGDGKTDWLKNKEHADNNIQKDERKEWREEGEWKETDCRFRGRNGSLVRVDTWPLLLLSSIPSLFSTLSRSRSLSPPSTWARVQRRYRHEARRWWGWGGGSFITLSLNLCISFSSCRQGSISIVFKQGTQSKTNWTQLLFPAAWMPEELVQQCEPWK